MLDTLKTFLYTDIYSNFIVVEGCDLSGKTTLAKGLVSRYKEWASSEPVYFREPGSTPLSEGLRNLMFGNPDLSDSTMALLMNASRLNLLESCLKLAIHQRTVICDRYCFSTLAYQGWSSKELFDKIVLLHELFIHVLPRIIIFTYSSPEVLESRSLQRVSDHSENTFDEKYKSRLLNIQNFMGNILLNQNVFSLKVPVILTVDTSDLTPDELVTRVISVLNTVRKAGSTFSGRIDINTFREYRL